MKIAPGKLGLVAFPSNSGLGTATWELSKWLKPTKTLLVSTKYQEFPERFENTRPISDVSWLLDGIDVVLAVETPVDWDIFAQAKKKGIKTVLVPMYECTPHPLPSVPDTIVCVSDLDYDVYKALYPERCIRLDFPVNRKLLKPSFRTKAKVFQMNAGHGGLFGRNGLSELLAAIPMLKSDARIIIHSQKSLNFSHPKADIRVGNYEHYWDVWTDEADVAIFPHKFDGLSLPIQEALSKGKPVLSTAIYPFTRWLPKHWLFTPTETVSLKVQSRHIDVAVLDPASIAEMIDEWYDKDIRQESKMAHRLAEKLSWKTLLPHWQKLL